MNADFVHLHLHTEYSLLDGACRIAELPAAIKKAGQTAAAITDHGVMYGAVDFYKACKKEGIKPIIGCEIYVAPHSRFGRDVSEDAEYAHLVLLCENETGYRNLIAIVSAAFTEGFYRKPRADYDLLREHHEGLIALSACLAGAIPKAIMNNDTDAAKEHAKTLNEIFGQGNFFLELQDHSIPEQHIVNSVLVGLSGTLGIPLVATNDVHYIEKSDAEIQNILMCIQMNKTLSDKRDFAFETEEFYLKTADEMAALFGAYPEALENTVRIAERCHFDFDFDHLKLPAFYPPDGLSSKDYLYKLCEEGLARRFAAMDAAGTAYDADQYRDRLAYELRVVVQMGYAEYYLIVNDFIAYAKSQSIPVGPGRGSGAGSLAAFCLGITDVDPIKYDLLFERFLNPERVSMPDFDVDFCYVRREEVIDYVARKYGADHVAQIVTFGTLAARQSIRDVGRVMGLPYNEVDEVAGGVPMALNMTIDRALEENPDLKARYTDDLTVRHLIDVAKKLEGMPRHASVHAAGVVVTDKPVAEYVPLAYNRECVVTQFTMNTVADLGLLKIDFLGLRYLTVISDAEKEVQKTHPGFDITGVDLFDKDAYALMSAGDTDGVFQLESAGMKSLMRRMKPVSIEDVTAAISLYRPGPMDSIPRYLENRKNPAAISYAIPELKEILGVTGGCIIYQEQVMQIFRKLAGYSFGRADIVRRAMSKKKIAVMNEEREYFLHGKKREDGTTECVGAIANGIDEAAAVALYDEISEFAKYAFNKSHAACYAFLAFRTAYLKAHFPKEYMCALINSVVESTEKVAFYIASCRARHIPVLPPDINRSGLDFTVDGDGIRFGLLAVKGVGRVFVDVVQRERENGDFTSLEDFLVRLPQGETNRHMIESLIRCGAFDGFGKKRSQMLAVYEDVIERVARRKKQSATGQYDMFAEESDSFAGIHVDYPDIEEMSLETRLECEREAAGIYLSGHPLDRYDEMAKAIGAVSCEEIAASAASENGGVPAFKAKQTVTVLGLVTDRRVIQTKSGGKMAFVKLEDVTGGIELIVFTRVFEMSGVLLEKGKVAAVTGELDFKDAAGTDGEEDKREAKILVNRVVPAWENGHAPLDNKPKTPESQPAAVQTEPAPAQNAATFTMSFGKMPTLNKSVPPRPAPPRETPKTPEQTGELRLYLRVEDENGEAFERVKKLLEIFSYGSVPVYVHFPATKKTVKPGFGVALNPTMEAYLCELLGEENVKTVRK